MAHYTGLPDTQLPFATTVTIGNFDGVHLGHQALLSNVVKIARQAEQPTKTVLVTFDPHPIQLLRPDYPLSLLTTPLERVQIACGLGIDIGVIVPFTRDVAAMDAASFVALLKERLNMHNLVVGPDFALGKARGGSLKILATLGKEYEYRLIVQDHIEIEGRSVRSKTIRELLVYGYVAEAAKYLGRHYHMCGVVVHGDKRGRQIGIPTANLLVPDDKLWPSNGVYATRTWIREDGTAQAYDSVTNIGVRPTVNGDDKRFETHLLDFPRDEHSPDLYGSELVVELVERLRGEIRFESIEQLVTQIHADIVQARDIMQQVSLDNEPFFVRTLS